MPFANPKARAAYFATEADKRKGLTYSPESTQNGPLTLPKIPTIDKPHAMQSQPKGMNFTTRPKVFKRIKSMLTVK